MRAFLRQIGLTATILVLAVSPLSPRRVGRAQTARQLPGEIQADQTPPDITITGGFAQVTGIGDFNGDGVDDFLVKYERWIGEASSLVFFKFGIIFGKRGASLPVTINLVTDEPDLALTTKLKPPLAYSDISTRGDINGDGIDDIILEQVLSEQVNQTGQTSFKVFLGSPEFRPGSVDLDALPSSLTVISGWSGVFNSLVEGAADVNGDGAKDLLLSINGSYVNYSAAILLGPFAPGATIDLRSQPPDILIEATNRTDVISGSFLADVNGDGNSDLLIRRSRFDGPTGLYLTVLDIVFGASDWKAGKVVSLATQTPDATVVAGFNYSVIQIGDVNGDGIADILTGVPTYYGEPAPPAWFTGSVNIFFGSPSLRGSVSQPDMVIAGLPVPAGFRPVSYGPLGDHLGESIAVSDVNGDGVPDILIGAPGVTTNDKGRVRYTSRAYLIIGSAETKRGTVIQTVRSQQDVTISFDATASGFGRRIASGDFNGDGIRDVLVASDAVAYVYFSGPLRPAVISSAQYKSGAAALSILGTDFTGAARVEINGLTVDRDVAFDAEQGKLVMQGSRSELNLHDGKNQVVVIRKGVRSNAVKIKMK